jgi:heat shock protein HtpX
VKRVVLFLLTNLAVVVVLGTVLSVLGADRYLTQQGVNVGGLLVFSVVVGFTGSFVSLLLSKTMAKWSTGAQLITGREGSSERWLVDTVTKLAQRAGVAMPEVAIYEGAPNAFATGAFKNSALVAVSTGLLQAMRQQEIEAVLGHEMAHVANGDMVTLTLIQGVLNTFVLFLSRVVGYIVDRMVFRQGDEHGVGMGFYITVFVCEILFGVLATIIVMWFSRRREFRADRGSAEFLESARPMIGALQCLAHLGPGALPTAIRAMGINDRPSWTALFSSHPPIEERIAALQKLGR